MIVDADAQREGVAPRRGAGAAYAQVTRGLGLAIVSGRHPIGSLLPTNEILTERFGVSRSSLREALQYLAAKGMIHAKSRVGTRVLDSSHWDLYDAELLSWRIESGVDATFLTQLFEMRQAFEPVAAAMAAVRRTDAQAARLFALAVAMADHPTDRAKFVEVDVAFHHCVLEACGNPFMQSSGALIKAALTASLDLSAPHDAARTCQSSLEHGRVAKAILARLPQRAASAMSSVIRRGGRNCGLPRPEGKLVARMPVRLLLGQ